MVELPAASASASMKSAPSTGPSYRRRQLHLQHSLYSGPRPQHQHRNHQLQRSRQLCGPLTMSALSPPRIVPINTDRSAGGGDDDSDSNQSISQSLYAPPSALSPCSSETSSCGTGHGSVVLMEESWYVTPPPCFTSIGPINMEASPFENLLIEHPRLVIFVLHKNKKKTIRSFPKTKKIPHATAKHAQHCVYLIFL